MEFTPIGFVCLAAAVLVAAQPVRLGLLIIALFIPLQTAAAVNLWAVGGMSIICAHVLIGALAVGLALRPATIKSMMRTTALKPSVLFFGFFVFYGLLSAYMMPRLFEGEVQVYSLERNTDIGISLAPLHPSTGNISQSFYIAVDFVLFVAVAFLVARPRGLTRITHAINAMTVLHLTFALVSIVPHLPPAAMLLDFVRTANYAINAHHVIAGIPRLIGSYAEPSVFGAMSTGLFAWNFLRFLQTFGLWHLTASLLLLACVVFSLSTTAYAVLVLLVGIWGLASAYKLVRRGLTSDHVRAISFGLILTAPLIFALFFVDPAQQLATTVYERLFGMKLESVSGIERGAWNMQGLRNFVETNGFGVGLGSARASSLATVLLGNVGLIGAVLYLGFLNRSFVRFWPETSERRHTPETIRSHRIFSAARAAAMALLLGHLISGTNIDGGLLFIMFAGTAAATIIPVRRRNRALNIQPNGWVGDNEAVVAHARNEWLRRPAEIASGSSGSAQLRWGPATKGREI